MTEKKGRRRGGNQSPKLSAYDNALVKAKIEKKVCHIELALPLSYTDEEGKFTAEVCHVDTYAVQFDLGPRGKPWVSKAFIVSVIVHD